MTALLFLIERAHTHTETHIYICMAFLKIKVFACVPMGRFGEKGEPELLQDFFWSRRKSSGRKAGTSRSR